MGMFTAYAASSGKMDELEALYRDINIGRKAQLFWQVFAKNMLLEMIDAFLDVRDELHIPVFFPISYIPVFSVRYYELLGKFNPVWEKYMNAASNFPLLKVFPNFLNHRFAIDGGATDNIPLYPLLRTRQDGQDEFDVIFVLHFDTRYDWRRDFVTDVPVIDLDVSYCNDFSKNHFDFSEGYICEMVGKSYEYGKALCDRVLTLSDKADIKAVADEIFLEEHEKRMHVRSVDTLVSVLNVAGKALRNEKRCMKKLY